MAVFQRIVDNKRGRGEQNHGFPFLEQSVEGQSVEGLFKAVVCRFNVNVHLSSAWTQYTS